MKGWCAVIFGCIRAVFILEKNYAWRNYIKYLISLTKLYQSSDSKDLYLHTVKRKWKWKTLLWKCVELYFPVMELRGRIYIFLSFSWKTKPIL